MDMLWEKGKILKLFQGIIHLVRAQDFPKNYYFSPLDTHTDVLKNVTFSENLWMIPLWKTSIKPQMRIKDPVKNLLWISFAKINTNARVSFY